MAEMVECVIQIVVEANGDRYVEVLVDGVSDRMLGPYSLADAEDVARQIVEAAHVAARGRLQ